MECTVPDSAFPSHFKSTLTVFRSPAFGPQSPVHVPVSGSLPRCSASAGSAIARQTKRQNKRIEFLRIYPPSIRHYSRARILTKLRNFRLKDYVYRLLPHDRTSRDGQFEEALPDGQCPCPCAGRRLDQRGRGRVSGPAWHVRFGQVHPVESDCGSGSSDIGNTPD